MNILLIVPWLRVSVSLLYAEHSSVRLSHAAPVAGCLCCCCRLRAPVRSFGIGLEVCDCACGGPGASPAPVPAALHKLVRVFCLFHCLVGFINLKNGQ